MLVLVNMSHIKVAKGTRDHAPDQMFYRNLVMTKMRDIFQAHGAQETDTPVFELTEILMKKYGEESKLIYNLADQGGEQLSLRYDLTVPFARFLASHNFKKNMLRFQFGKVYRRDNPSIAQGRFREFLQCDCDLTGTYGEMIADSEIVYLAHEVLTAVRIGSFYIRINHRRLLTGILEISGCPENVWTTVCSSIDKLDKKPWSFVRMELIECKGLSDTVVDKIASYVLCKGCGTFLKSLLNDIDLCKSSQALEGIHELIVLASHLDVYGISNDVVFDLSLARGLDYYTGIIFECVSLNEVVPKLGSIAAGGRYDGLISQVSGLKENIPAIGISFGFDRIMTILEACNPFNTFSIPLNCYVVSTGSYMTLERMRIASILWRNGLSCSFYRGLSSKLIPQLQEADLCKASFVIIIGEEEYKENKIIVKNMSEHTQLKISETDLLPYLSSQNFK